MKKITLKKFPAAAIHQIKIALNDYCLHLDKKIQTREDKAEILYSELMQLEICLSLAKKIESKQLYESKHYSMKMNIQDAVCSVQALIHSSKIDSSDYTIHIAEKTQESINKQLINL